MLPCPPVFSKEVDRTTFSFIWNGKPPKIKKVHHYFMQIKRRPQNDRFCSFQHGNQSWYKRFCSPSDADWKTIPQYFLKKFGSNLIFKCNHSYKLLELDDCPQFFKAVLSSWQEVRDSFTEQIIWNNKAILVNSKPIFFILGTMLS